MNINQDNFIVLDFTNIKEIAQDDVDFIQSILDTGLDRLHRVDEKISIYTQEETIFHIHKLKSSIFYFLKSVEIKKYEKMEFEIRKNGKNSVSLWRTWFTPFFTKLNQDLSLLAND